MANKITVILIALTLLSSTVGCDNTKETPSLLYPSRTSTELSALTEAAMKTHGAYLRDANFDYKKDIPEKFWAKRIRDLKPLRVYIHNIHMVIVQKIYGNIEEGVLIYNPVSSIPVYDGKDGFKFTEQSGHYAKYKRTLK